MAKTSIPAKPAGVASRAAVRVPGEVDNAGRVAAPRADTPAEVIAKAESAERSALSPSIHQAKATLPLKGDTAQQMAAMQARMDELEATNRGVMEANRALLRQVRSNAVDMPREKVLPTVESLMEAHDNGELDGPVLTREGWLVPAVTPSNPVQQLTAAALAALTGSTPSERREKREKSMEKGKKDALADADQAAGERAESIRSNAASIAKAAENVARA